MHIQRVHRQIICTKKSMKAKTLSLAHKINKTLQTSLGSSKTQNPKPLSNPKMIISSGVRTCFPRFPSSSEKHVLRSAVKFTFTIQRPRRPFTTACSVSATKKEKVIVVSGPTGAGKSRLALELAKLLNGEIISADSVQV